MANIDDSQLNEESGARTYGAKDVHKRRVDRKSRPKPSRPAEPSEQEEPEPKRDATRTRFTDMPGLLPENDNADASTDVDAPTPSENVNEAPASEKASKLSLLRSKLPSPLAPSRTAQETADAEPADSKSLDSSPTEREEQQRTAPFAPTSESVNASSEEDEASSPAPRERRSAPKQPAIRPGLRVALIVLGIIVVLAILFGGLFTWNRWYRFDDHADLQGDWYVAGTAVPITIDSSAINLTPDVIYDYELDDHDKTITYTFGPMQGHGSYWFSGDRQYLVIVDDNSTAAQELPNDALSQTFRSLGDTKASNLPTGDGVIAFNRKPSPLAKAEQSIVSRTLSEKAAKEAEEQREAEEQAAEEAASYGYYYY